MKRKIRSLRVDPVRLVTGALLLGLLALLVHLLIHEANQELTKLHQELDRLETKVGFLEIEQKKSKRHPIFQQSSPAVTSEKGPLKEGIFKELYLLNANRSPEKKIKVLPGQLLIQDPQVADHEAFYDLLGLLLDEDALKQIALPSGQPFRKLRKELLRFGILEDMITTSSDGQFRLLIELK